MCISRNTLKRIVFIVLILAVFWYGQAIGLALGAARFYVELRLDGFSHDVAMCELPEFTDNLIRVLDIASEGHVRPMQHAVYAYWCEGISPDRRAV
jgi:hypothetical protein